MVLPKSFAVIGALALFSVGSSSCVVIERTQSTSDTSSNQGSATLRRAQVVEGPHGAQIRIPAGLPMPRFTIPEGETPEGQARLNLYTYHTLGYEKDGSVRQLYPLIVGLYIVPPSPDLENKSYSYYSESDWGPNLLSGNVPPISPGSNFVVEIPAATYHIRIDVIKVNDPRGTPPRRGYFKVNMRQMHYYNIGAYAHGSQTTGFSSGVDSRDYNVNYQLKANSLKVQE